MRALPRPAFPALALLWLAGCGGDAKPPPKAAHEGAGTQVKRVAVRWGDTVEEDIFLGHDPHGVRRLQVITRRQLTLGDGASAALRVDRDEVFHMDLGTFRCKAGGTLKGDARYAWHAGEAEVHLALPDGELPRACDRPGFPILAKALGATEMVLVLRGDRLIGKSSARDHTVLLPLQ